MKQLRTTSKSKQLQQQSNLKVKLENEMPWTTYFNVLKRQAELQMHVSEISNEQLYELLAGPSAEHHVDDILKKLLKLSYAVIRLQYNDWTLQNTRV